MKIALQSIASGLIGLVVFGLLVFWPAGTFDYWQGWLSLGIFAASTVGFTVYLAIYDRPLLERRLKAGPQHEREWSQKIIVSLVLLAFFALIVPCSITETRGRRLPRGCRFLAMW